MGSAMQKLSKVEQDLFFWVCRDTDLSIWYIINNYKDIDPLESTFLLFALFDKGYLEGHDYRSGIVPNVSMVSVTRYGREFFADMYPEEIDERTSFWDSCKKKKQVAPDLVVDSNELSTFFIDQGYEVEWEDQYTLVVRQGFARYYVYKTPVSLFTEFYYLENIVKKTHSILLVVPNERLRQKAITGIRQWIFECFKQMQNFLEEGNAYAVITIDELKKTPLFPRYLPENTHQYY